jgi:CorA-like Mg2+ transporter protein
MSAILFDREQVDHLDELPDRPERLNGSKLLWVDLDRADPTSAERIAHAFELDDATRDQLASSSVRAVFHDYGRYIHVTTYSPCEEQDDDNELIALECVVGKNWVITAHDRPVAVLQEFADRVSGSGDTGVLDGPAFLATLLEWVLGAYTAAFERPEERLEETEDPDPDELAWRPLGSPPEAVNVGDSLASRLADVVSPTTQAGRFRWEKQLTIPGVRGDKPLRLVVREVEFRTGDQDPSIGGSNEEIARTIPSIAAVDADRLIPRIVYADAARLG